jgi:tryptophan-rich sensory protein
MRRKLLINVLIGVLICLAVGYFSSMATRISVDTWYPTLKKPFFNPPNWLFAPVWTLLYLLMGIAVGRIWFFGLHHRWGKTALYHFGFQLIFNGLWSLVFFGLKNPVLGFVVIIILLILIERSIKWFKMVDLLSAQLLYPYLAWVTFATLLNTAIVVLNYL